jgi:hypothetical protein
VSDVDDIRQQMALIRHDMHHNVSNVVSDVEGAMDWRSVIRNHPYISLGVGLAVGYFIVPKRRRRVERVVESVQPIVAAATPEYLLASARPEKPSKSLARKTMGWAIGLLWPLVSQSVQAYAAMWLESQLKQHLNPNPGAPREESPPSPAGGPGESYGGDAVYRMPKRG